MYPITLDVSYIVFSKLGVIIKAITFNKNNQFQALIQMGDEIETESAKLTLHGQNIYNGCCTLRIEYSKLSCLNVKYNNDKSRDYTQPNLSSGGVAGGSSYGSRLLSTPSSSLLSKTSSLLPESLQTSACCSAPTGSIKYVFRSKRFDKTIISSSIPSKFLFFLNGWHGLPY